MPAQAIQVRIQQSGETQSKLSEAARIMRRVATEVGEVMAYAERELNDLGLPGFAESVAWRGSEAVATFERQAAAVDGAELEVQGAGELGEIAKSGEDGRVWSTGAAAAALGEPDSPASAALEDMASVLSL